MAGIFDKNRSELSVGDVVLVPCTITSLTPDHIGVRAVNPVGKNWFSMKADPSSVTLVPPPGRPAAPAADPAAAAAEKPTVAAPVSQVAPAEAAPAAAAAQPAASVAAPAVAVAPATAK